MPIGRPVPLNQSPGGRKCDYPSLGLVLTISQATRHNMIASPVMRRFGSLFRIVKRHCEDEYGYRVKVKNRVPINASDTRKFDCNNEIRSEWLVRGPGQSCACFSFGSVARNEFGRSHYRCQFSGDRKGTMSTARSRCCPSSSRRTYREHDPWEMEVYGSTLFCVIQAGAASGRSVPDRRIVVRVRSTAFRRSAREEERPGAPGAASATPAHQRI